jgi:hypothetical protein
MCVRIWHASKVKKIMGSVLRNLAKVLCFILLDMSSRAEVSVEVDPSSSSLSASSSQLEQDDGSSSSSRAPLHNVAPLSWAAPRVYHYPGFLSDEECDFLVTFANQQPEFSSRSKKAAGAGALASTYFGWYDLLCSSTTSVCHLLCREKKFRRIIESYLFSFPETSYRFIQIPHSAAYSFDEPHSHVTQCIAPKTPTITAPPPTTTPPPPISPTGTTCTRILL